VRLTGLFAFVLPLIIYWRFPSSFWNFDGVACAAAVELGNPLYWFHAQHLIYGFLGFLSWTVLAPIGFVRALPVLQLLSSVLSAMGAYYLYRTLVDQMGHRLLALGLSTAAACSAVVWIWSIEAQVYALGYLGLAAATYTLFSPASKHRSWALGAWHALAILGHIVHVLWIFPLYVYLRNDRPTLKRYAIAVTSFVGVAYALVAVFVIAPYQGEAQWLSHWLKGSLGLTPDRSIAWHWHGFVGAWLWLKTLPQMWWGSLTPAASLSIVLFVFLMSRLIRHTLWTERIRFCLVWIGVYAVFFSTWEPTTLCYRMTDVLPWTLLLAMGVSTLSSPKVARVVVAGWVLSLAGLNGWSKILPMHDIKHNTAYQQTLALAKITPAESVYLTAGGIPWIYLLYFTGRSGWNAVTLSPQKLETFSKPLYAHTALLSDPRLRDWIHQHAARQVAPDIPWLEIS